MLLLWGLIASALASEVGTAHPLRELATWSVDLNRDQEPEAFSVWMSEGGDYSHFELRISGIARKGKFFGIDGEVPEIRVVMLGDKQQTSAIELRWPSDPDSYSYSYLRWTGEGIVDLVTVTDNDRGVSRPTVTGDGRLSMRFWMGFWYRTEEYVLNAARTSLDKASVGHYRLDVAGTVVRPFALYATPGAAKKVGEIKAGSTVHLRKWDPDTDRYLAYDGDKILGWAKVSPQQLAGLPWAG